MEKLHSIKIQMRNNIHTWVIHSCKVIKLKNIRAMTVLNHYAPLSECDDLH